MWYTRDTKGIIQPQNILNYLGYSPSSAGKIKNEIEISPLMRYGIW
jgi:hypothetical protein